MRMQFLNDWTFMKEGTGQEIPVILPHDAMLSERRTDGSAGGKGIAWFEGGVYRYTKRFDRPACGEVFLLEMEGVYRKAEVLERYGDDVQDLLIDAISSAGTLPVPPRTDFTLIL